MSSRAFIPSEELQSGTGATRWKVAPLRHGDAIGPAGRIEAAFQEALEKGLAQGYAAGRQEALDEAARAAGQLAREAASQAEAQARSVATLCETLAAWRAPLGAELARDVVGLALAIARKVVDRELRQDPEAIVHAVARGLAALPREPGPVDVEVHPDDAARLRAVLDGNGNPLARHALRLVPNAHLARGGCRIDSPSGDVDASLETRWAAVLVALDASAADSPDDGGAP